MGAVAMAGLAVSNMSPDLLAALGLDDNDASEQSVVAPSTDWTPPAASGLTNSAPLTRYMEEEIKIPKAPWDDSDEESEDDSEEGSQESLPNRKAADQEERGGWSREEADQRRKEEEKMYSQALSDQQNLEQESYQSKAQYFDLRDNKLAVQVEVTDLMRLVDDNANFSDA